MTYQSNVNIKVILYSVVIVCFLSGSVFYKVAICYI